MQEARIAWRPFGGSPKIASARLRSFLPCRFLQAEGWPCEIYNPLHKEYYQVVVFQKTYQEEDYHEALSLKQRGAKVVFDLCDNHLYVPEDNPTLAERSQKLRRMIDVADWVTVSSPELIEWVAHPRVRVVDDAVDDRYEALANNPAVRSLMTLNRMVNHWGDKTFRLVWFGNAGSESPPFGLIDLPTVIPALDSIQKRYPVSLTVISNSKPLFQHYTKGASFPTRYIAWKHHTFPWAFTTHDLCILPITPNPFTWCKTNNRLLLSLLLGVPVVTDMIPSYREFEGMVLSGDWEAGILSYLENPELRKRHVQQARAYIASTYNRQRVINQWTRLFHDLLGYDPCQTKPEWNTGGVIP